MRCGETESGCARESEKTGAVWEEETRGGARECVRENESAERGTRERESERVTETERE